MNHYADYLAERAEPVTVPSESLSGIIFDGVTAVLVCFILTVVLAGC